MGTILQRRFIWIIGIVGICYGLIAYAGVTHALRWALMNEARSSGSDWAHHIENQLQGLSGMQTADGDVNVQTLPTRPEFHKLVSDVLAIGRIYQIDYINIYCLCDISVGSFLDVPADQSNFLHYPGDGDDHGEDDVSSFVSGLPIAQQLDFALGQGHYFARPMPAGEVPIFLAQRNSIDPKQYNLSQAG